jgi:hypothetical protein
MKKPYWIKVGLTDETNEFEGHQGHWADCYFSNSTYKAIMWYLRGPLMENTGWEIREMTDEELKQYPEALEFQKFLIEEYGEF